MEEKRELGGEREGQRERERETGSGNVRRNAVRERKRGKGCSADCRLRRMWRRENRHGGRGGRRLYK